MSTTDESETARRVPDHFHLPAHRKHRSVQAPVILHAEDDIFAVCDFGSGIDSVRPTSGRSCIRPQVGECPLPCERLPASRVWVVGCAEPRLPRFRCPNRLPRRGRTRPLRPSASAQDPLDRLVVRTRSILPGTARAANICRTSVMSPFVRSPPLRFSSALKFGVQLNCVAGF